MRWQKALKMLFTPHKTFSQRRNLVRALISYYLRRTEIDHYPVVLYIDSSNRCNLGCLLCPSGTKREGRTMGIMQFDVFKQVIDEVSPYLWMVNLHNWGEPFLNKAIFDMIRYARERQIDVRISTNLNIFNDRIAENIITSGVNTLIISLDGVSQESVEAYQRGNDFKRVIGNLRKLIATKRTFKSKHPTIIWRYIVNRYNEHEIDKAKAVAKEIGVDKIEFLPIRVDMALELFQDQETQFVNIQPWLPKDESLSMYDYQARRRKGAPQRCSIPWFESVVHPNGSVSPCCGVWPEQYDFGNVQEASFLCVWQGEAYRRSRRINVGQHCDEDAHHICAICNRNRAQIW